MPTKVQIVKAVVFPVVMYGCESWTIKKAERRKIDPFELWYWRRLLRVPWTARRSNQSILKEISPGCSLEGLMLKLKLQYFGHLRWRADSVEKTLMLGKTEGKRRRGDRGWDAWMASQALGDSEGQDAWCAAVRGAAKGWTQLGDSTTTTWLPVSYSGIWVVSVIFTLTSISTANFLHVNIDGHFQNKFSEMKILGKGMNILAALVPNCLTEWLHPFIFTLLGINAHFTSPMSWTAIFIMAI